MGGAARGWEVRGGVRVEKGERGLRGGGGEESWVVRVRNGVRNGVRGVR